MSRPPTHPEWVAPFRTASSPSPLKSSPDGNEWVFKSPPELMCPIGHEVFHNPVINVAGQIYERSNIEQHLLRHNSDPVTGSRLQSKALTPVYSLRSRAAEFREAAARHCVEVATTIGTSSTDAVRFVRRASDLCEALSGPVPGLSTECMEYTRSHPSNVYDSAVLHSFAEGLCKASYRDKGAAVYFALLQAGEDRAKQAEMLQKFVSCWPSDNDAGRPQNMQDCLSRLVESMHQSSSPLPAHFVKVAQEANLGYDFLSGLCERYLATSATEPLDERFFDPKEWVRQKDMMLQYIQLSCNHVIAIQQEADSKMDEVNKVGEEMQVWMALNPFQAEVQISQPEERKEGRGRMQWAAAFCLVGSSILRPELVGVRVAKAVSIAVLLQLRK